MSKIIILYHIIDDAAGDKVRAHVTSGKYAATGRGSSKFVPHSMLPANLGKNTEFIYDDCLCFKISKVDVKHIAGSLSVSGLHSDSTTGIHTGFFRRGGEMRGIIIKTF